MTTVRLLFLALITAVALFVSFKAGQVSDRQSSSVSERHNCDASETFVDKVTTRITPNVPSPTTTPQQFGRVIAKIVNEYRNENSLKYLSESVPTCSIANARLEEVKSDYSHSGFYKFSSIYGIDIGENLSENYFLPQDVLSAWIKSPKHKENLDRAWNHMCIATDGVYVVQIFSL